MAAEHPTVSDASLQPDVPANLDLLQRYCPGLTAHPPAEIAKYIPTDPTQCWGWPTRQPRDAYGRVGAESMLSAFSTTVPVHRYLYDCLVGTVAMTNPVHHRCRNKACWNPFHLEEVTPTEHKQRHQAPWDVAVATTSAETPRVTVAPPRRERRPTSRQGRALLPPSLPASGNTPQTLGEKVAELRAERGWSQRELARRSMVRPALISDLERGKKRDTTGRVIKRLALVLHVSMDYLGGMYDGL